MTLELETIYDRLYAWCEEQGFAGYDPFDGLNSRIFQATPLKYSRAARLAWLQMVKRSPVDLRRLLLVEKGVNPKTLALFALAEIALFRASRAEKHAEDARKLLGRLYGLRIDGKNSSGKWLAFGYNFDWQSRVFFAPKGTPAIVPTAFAQQAFIEGYLEFRNEMYLDASQQICRFIIGELNRPVETDDEICFSYTPLDRSVVYNASLLAGECLARVAAIKGETSYAELAVKAARFVVRRQRDDGAWAYGADARQNWADNFHTAYILVSLSRIMNAIPGSRTDIEPAIACGSSYWLDNFFLADGTPKYYDNETYPIDIHSAAAAIAALCEPGLLDGRADGIAETAMAWTRSNMLDPDGSFYYQRRKSGLVKTPFMRWGQAWMAYALARVIEREHYNKLNTRE
jgi:hypothetical protein